VELGSREAGARTKSPVSVDQRVGDMFEYVRNFKITEEKLLLKTSSL